MDTIDNTTRIEEFERRITELENKTKSDNTTKYLVLGFCAVLAITQGVSIIRNYQLANQEQFILTKLVELQLGR